MSRTIGMPKFGLTMETGLVSKWLKAEGDRVERGESLLEIATDKIVNEYESPHSGYLLQILVPEGQEAKVTEPICVLGEKGEKVDSPAPAPKPNGAATTPKGVSAKPPAPAQKVRVSPLARKLAEKHGLDLTTIQGTGPRGRIVKDDVEHALQAGPTPSSVPTPAAPRPGVTPMSKTRRLIAERLSTSKREIPHFYLKIPVDMTRAKATKADLATAKATPAEKVTLTHLILSATAKALREIPGMTVSFSPEGVVHHDAVNVGLAVDVPAGLIVPVVREADAKPFRELVTAANNLVAKARDGKLALEEISGGTFTITNMGMYGITEFAAIINPPEAAILAVGAIQDTAVAQAGELCVKPIMILTLSVDHRIIDGALGARFLNRLKELLEHPALLLV